MPDDRRATPRASCVLEGMWWGLSGKQQSRIVSLSVSGCYVESLAQPQAGERMQVRLELPEGPLVLEGDVVYGEPRMGFAVRFVDVTPEAHATLTTAVQRMIGHVDKYG